MARLRFMAVALLALALAGNSTQTGRTQTDRSPVVGNPSDGSVSGPSWTVTRTTTAADNRSCMIYSLTDMGFDANLGRWIAQTIPEMIESKSWQQSGGSGVLRYYVPKNILIVNNSTEIQAKVGGFLKNMKSSLPKMNHARVTTKKSSHGSVVPADYRAPALGGISGPLPEPSGYPVPAPVKAPKHLFHFLIRYEGEGIIDDNVVKFMKIQNQVGNGSKPGTTMANSYSAPSGTTMPSTDPLVGPAVSSGYSSPASTVIGNPSSTLAPSTSITPSVAQPKQKEDTKEEKKEKPGVQSQPTR